MIHFKRLVIAIFCLSIRLTRAEDRISVDTVGTITATAGYSIADGQSPTSASLTSSLDFPIDHGGVSSKETTSASSESGYTPAPPETRNAQSLALRSRQARGKPPPHWSQSGQSVEEKDHEIHFDHHHRLNEQLYNVKPQTFDDQRSHHHPSSTSTDSKSSDESTEKSMVPAITYGKKMIKNDGHDDRPVFGDWSEEVRMKFDTDKPVSRSRKRNKHHQQDGSQPEKRKPQTVKTTTAITSSGGSSIGGSGDNRDGWQEVSPNMEIATGFSTTVHEHDSSQESQSSGSSESYKTHPIVYQPEPGSISSIEDTAQAEPQHFNHKQVLSKMNHFDFSNAVSQTTKSSPPREKRLNYQPGGSGGLSPPPTRYAYAGGQPLQSMVPSSPPSAAAAAAAAVKSLKIEQPVPNYHSIVVPIPITHQMYAAIGGDPTSPAHGHQLASSTVQQAMMSLPVVHNVFFKTDENGGGKTMPAIVIPLKPEYLQHLQQQQQYLNLPDPGVDSLNAAGGHQRPVHHNGAGTKTVQTYQQQQQQQQKQKPAKGKKPFGLLKDDQHRVKQPFGLQHQFYNNPYVGGGGGGHHIIGHQQHGMHQLHGLHALQHDPTDDSRYAQTAAAPGPTAVQPFSNSLMGKRPHAYGYAPPMSVAPKYVAVNKSPPPTSPQHQQQQQMSAEDMGNVQSQLQPYRATTFHPGYAYLTGPEDDYPYRPVYKDMKKRNDVLVVRSERRK